MPLSKLADCALPAKFKPVTHCIFDLDGTILDTETIHKHTLTAMVTEYGKIFTNEYHNTLTGMVENDTCVKIIKDFELEMSPEDFLQEFRRRTDSLLADSDFMPGVVKLIQHLYDHKIPLAIGTSSPQYAVELKFSKKREVFDLFHHVVCGGSDPEVIHGKPAPDIFLIAARRFSDSPCPPQCLVFEDSTNGVKAALSAGMQVVMIPEPEVRYENWKLATLRLDSLDYMAPELFGLPAFGSPLPLPNESKRETVEEPTSSDDDVEHEVLIDETLPI